MNRLSKDIFHRISEEQFRKLITESTSIRQVFHKMNLCVSGDHYKPFRRRVEELKIDLSHFRGNYKAGERFRIEIPIEKMFKEGTTHTSTTLSRRIRKHNLLEYKCTKCPNTGIWLGEPLTLQLDHINGNTTDNRIENLRYLCPNCHTQTSTYARRSQKNIQPTHTYSLIC